MRKVIPIIRAETLIPEGDFCYQETAGQLKACPFWAKLDSMVARYGEHRSGYCHYLKMGDWMPDGTFLLSDQVKECGVKYLDDEFGDHAFVTGVLDALPTDAPPPPVKLQGQGTFEVPRTCH